MHRVYDVTLQLDNGTTTTVRTSGNTRAVTVRRAKAKHARENPDGPKATTWMRSRYVPEAAR